jgi:uncharacterized protein
LLRVAVLGASPNPSRYSNQAVRDLLLRGHEVFPVNPGHKSIEGLQTLSSIKDLSNIDTLTIYVSPKHISSLISEIVELHPRRVIINPGAESSALSEALSEAGIQYLEGCTLVMLRSGQF